MTAIDLDVPAGTRLHLLGGEISPNPTGHDELVLVVAAEQQPTDGMVLVHGHVCTYPNPDCGTAYCFEAKVAVSGVRANLDGSR